MEQANKKSSFKFRLAKEWIVFVFCVSFAVPYFIASKLFYKSFIEIPKYKTGHVVYLDEDDTKVSSKFDPSTATPVEESPSKITRHPNPLILRAYQFLSQDIPSAIGEIIFIGLMFYLIIIPIRVTLSSVRIMRQDKRKP